MSKSTSIKDKMQAAKGTMTGFDYLRIILSISVLVWHSVFISTGSRALDAELWSGPYRFLAAAILPMFFALSGFLVSGSLERNSLYHFIILRLARLIPALAIEITLSALVIGLLFTQLPIWEYLASSELHSYFLNIIGVIQYTLPGVFETNPRGNSVNAQLWTIPFELECYLALILLSIVTLLRRRMLFVVSLLLVALAMTAWALAGHPVNPIGNLPGRMLVLSFLVAVAIYLYRDIIPYSNTIGVFCTLISAILLHFPNLCYIAAFPVGYVTVWLGMMRPPQIPFGDLSYGIYLFHYPIE